MANSQKVVQKREKTKQNKKTRSVMEAQDENRQKMTDDVTLLITSSGKGSLRKRRLSFQKEVRE